ncbi:hypothetical protein H257_16261 [Aphanomyces astaci]|uniref:DOPA 4,5-dioxygenase n=1 Tax=Aphanomyces astaci TaxID=112090 RepID=W4FJ69_APHAT|nr:hypothetical protein H257_16261 [Aphanomyces astaci]ETV67530.1 hypothetical protein H257_16261 [Aphanomyces astaci]|eukprot:XP_009842934.1 hypothetical protein H257_16261 [Aphanomyces astaci]
MQRKAAMKLLEWHFHVYFNQHDASQVHKAISIRNALVDSLNDADRAFVAVPLHHFERDSNEVQCRTLAHHGLNMKPVGPHPTGSFETWVPIESFSAAFEWFTSNRAGLSVLVHPLTVQEMRDHTLYAVWMGQPQALNLQYLDEELHTVPLQYPHFGLGYSAGAK